jgi:hypothetical protein
MLPTELERLTGLTAREIRGSRLARYVLVLDYGYAWVPAESSRTEEAIKRRRRQYSQWPSDKVRIIDQGE